MAMNFSTARVNPSSGGVSDWESVPLQQTSMTDMGSKRVILIIEDDADIRDAMAQILEDEGHHVMAASDGRAGLERLRERRPDLILLDLMMPIMNGWQFREAQRSQALALDVPVVVISADGAARAEALALGVRAFMRKPVELAALLEMVAQCTEPRASQA
jgi:CheY-like chemotaxis protein